ncbi:protein ELYS-like [Lingula anatina]|uniref:Protein ELYS-like n=1 Tax=Lingula anatina TaxID=7574 RepID=A0A1S3J6S5_LINAN|nr:protein ELYS-like [Lingula anatina]|eukprot:XP_013406117.1 protein ELYS-like [Lingula anatina]
MKDIPANFTSALVPFAAASLDCLENGRSSANEDPSQSCILSGVMKSGRLAWIARGDALEVINIATGARKAAWKFGALLQEERNPTITCVAEYSYANAPKLLIGLETGAHAGMLCMFDVKTSKVVKAVDFMHKVTAVEPVTNVLATEAPLQVLSEHLRCFCGVVAVGTQYGHLYLIDMCLDDAHDDSDELLPHALHVFTTKARDVMRRRDDALTRGEILALHLNNNAQVRGTFQYVQPDGELLESYIAEEVFVTSLKFVHPIGTLIVGFNFGCFQMWRLYEPVLDFSSKLDIDDVCPITHFAYQEPENDPRNFCYLWVARGPLPSDAGQDIVSTVHHEVIFDVDMAPAKALSQLVWRGPIGLVEPFEVFNSCLGAGLLPKNVELAASNLTAQAQRENLLSVALNHGAAGFITSCVSQFAEGEFVHAGCTLRFILDWAWGKVAQVKDSLDKLCVPLYDCSGMPLEQQGLQLFHQHQLQLTNLQTIVQVLMTNSGPSTSQGLGDLDMKFRVVTLINQFYQAVSWCLSNNLLPEFDEAESPPSGQYCYPASVLSHEYQTRRQQISRLHR